MSKKAANLIGIIGVAIFVFAWHANFAVPVSPFVMQHWHFIKAVLPLFALCCLIAAAFLGKRIIWIPASVLVAIGVVLFYLSLDL